MRRRGRRPASTNCCATEGRYPPPWEQGGARGGLASRGSAFSTKHPPPQPSLFPGRGAFAACPYRSEERPLWQECVSTRRPRWSPFHKKKKKNRKKNISTQ